MEGWWKNLVRYKGTRFEEYLSGRPKRENLLFSKKSKRNSNIFSSSMKYKHSEYRRKLFKATNQELVKAVIIIIPITIVITWNTSILHTWGCYRYSMYINHFKWHSLISSFTRDVFVHVVPILSFLVTPHIHLSIHNSTTCTLFVLSSLCFPTASAYDMQVQVSDLYTLMMTKQYNSLSPPCSLWLILYTPPFLWLLSDIETIILQH